MNKTMSTMFPNMFVIVFAPLPIIFTTFGMFSAMIEKTSTSIPANQSMTLMMALMIGLNVASALLHFADSVAFSEIALFNFRKIATKSVSTAMIGCDFNRSNAVLNPADAVVARLNPLAAPPSDMPI